LHRLNLPPIEGKGEAQASVGSVFADGDKQQGEDEGFGVFGRSSAFGGEGMLLAEALDEGVDGANGQGGERGMSEIAAFHRD